MANGNATMAKISAVKLATNGHLNCRKKCCIILESKRKLKAEMNIRITVTTLFMM